MSTQIRHFLITPEGGIREFTAEQASLVATGLRMLPELADRQARYLQLTLDDSEAGEIRVQTAGAAVAFDAQGRVAEPPAATEGQAISSFEHDAVVQWVLRDVPAVAPTFH